MNLRKIKVRSHCRWPTAALVLVVSAGLAQEDRTQEVESLTLQWTNLERQRNLLQSNWRTEEPVLEQQLVLLDREREELSAFLEQTEVAQDEVEARRLELLDRQSQLEREQAALEIELTTAIAQLQGLYRQLPPPMVVAWSERLPELDADYLTTSERLQVLLEMLGGLDDFQRRISLQEAVMTLPNGEEHLVKQVYLGLAQGWYLSANGLYAGVGQPSAEGWQWIGLDEPEMVDRLIAVLERRRNAEFLSLPILLGAVAGR